jgi:exopolyphosphatase/guanosine-5'-triphosphate,3'-diphosphate pyrophosphatase
MSSTHKHRPRAKSRKSLSQLARLIDPEPEHCFQVRRNAERLFAALATLHGLGEDAWRLLEAAALFHDIGHRRGFQGHHKHSRDMILEQEWPGLDERARLIVACVARYHRKSGPKPGHKHYNDLESGDQLLVG